eukprot:TRINITY_DN30011_c0_g1_i1.p1 TRINITY_DN30011_c0_g1~~TRINITY_DN30011_c0_g1_i1.p1  ORF type:complete len:296 (+),score=62.88 TRINITY_DN30011_c0_g1_i1:79-888(+)
MGQALGLEQAPVWAPQAPQAQEADQEDELPPGAYDVELDLCDFAVPGVWSVIVTPGIALIPMQADESREGPGPPLDGIALRRAGQVVLVTRVFGEWALVDLGDRGPCWLHCTEATMRPPLPGGLCATLDTAMWELDPDVYELAVPTLKGLRAVDRVLSDCARFCEHIQSQLDLEEHLETDYRSTRNIYADVFALRGGLGAADRLARSSAAGKDLVQQFMVRHFPSRAESGPPLRLLVAQLITKHRIPYRQFARRGGSPLAAQGKRARSD